MTGGGGGSRTIGWVSAESTVNWYMNETRYYTHINIDRFWVIHLVTYHLEIVFKFPRKNAQLSKVLDFGPKYNKMDPYRYGHWTIGLANIFGVKNTKQIRDCVKIQVQPIFPYSHITWPLHEGHLVTKAPLFTNLLSSHDDVVIKQIPNGKNWCGRFRATLPCGVWCFWPAKSLQAQWAFLTIVRCLSRWWWRTPLIGWKCPLKRNKKGDVIGPHLF